MRKSLIPPIHTTLSTGQEITSILQEQTSKYPNIDQNELYLLVAFYGSYADIELNQYRNHTSDTIAKKSRNSLYSMHNGFMGITASTIKYLFPYWDQNTVKSFLSIINPSLNDDIKISSQFVTTTPYSSFYNYILPESTIQENSLLAYFDNDFHLFAEYY